MRTLRDMSHDEIVGRWNHTSYRCDSYAIENAKLHYLVNELTNELRTINKSTISKNTQILASNAVTYSDEYIKSLHNTVTEERTELNNNEFLTVREAELILNHHNVKLNLSFENGLYVCNINSTDGTPVGMVTSESLSQIFVNILNKIQNTAQ